MGEGKRRRALALGGEAFDVGTGKHMGPIRHAGPLIVFLKYLARITEATKRGERIEVSVPCNGCNACCYHAEVGVDPAKERPEDLAHLDLVPNPEGGLMLRKREDGACVHLGTQGCTVHSHRPETCRRYDCRTPCTAGLSDRFGSHHAPAWVFDKRTKDDRIMDIALKMGAARFKNEHPDDWDPLSATQGAFDALPQTKPIARRLVEKFDALPLEEKQEFAEWYQQANGIG